MGEAAFQCCLGTGARALDGNASSRVPSRAPACDPGTAVNAQPGSFGAIDIAALQHLYGARAHNTTDDVYRFNDDVDFNRGYTTIWDTGGAHTIEYVGSSRAKIELRAVTLRNEIGGGG